MYKIYISQLKEVIIYLYLNFKNKNRFQFLETFIFYVQGEYCDWHSLQKLCRWLKVTMNLNFFTRNVSKHPQMNFQ